VWVEHRIEPAHNGDVMDPTAHLEVADALATTPGVVAVVLGGSRALGSATDSSDWDLGVYYRGPLDLTALSSLGHFYPPGSWGRIMNGGAWLTVRHTKVDVLLRDLATVEHWSARAAEGVFEIDALLGYVAGAPTYSLLAERAVAVPLHGTLEPVVEYPRRLAEEASARSRFNAQFSLDYAFMHARRGDVVGAVAQAAKAVFEEAHARLSERRCWVLNEKGIAQRAGLQDIQRLFNAIPDRVEGLLQWTADLRAELF
jgi:hypothetical protein